MSLACLELLVWNRHRPAKFVPDCEVQAGNKKQLQGDIFSAIRDAAGNVERNLLGGLRFDPPLHVRLKHVQRHCTILEYRVVKLPLIESRAELLLRF